MQSDRPTLRLLRSPSLDAATAHEQSLELLRAVKAGEQQGALRIVASRPTVAFGRRDTRLPGFAAAEAAARAHGFAPIVRAVGGRAAAFDEGALIIDQIEPDPSAALGQLRRFEHFAGRFVRVLDRLGVRAAIGELPGEYCPGAHSVHGIARRPHPSVKLVGTAQRVVGSAWLFSSVFVVRDASRLRAVTQDVYAALGLELDPGTVGAAADVAARPAEVTVPAAIAAVIDVWRESGVRFEQ